MNAKLRLVHLPEENPCLSIDLFPEHDSEEAIMRIADLLNWKLDTWQFSENEEDGSIATLYFKEFSPSTIESEQQTELN
jgi:hypothetical protein